MSKQPHNNLNIFRWHLIDYFDITKVQFRAVDESHIDLNLKGFGVESKLTMSYKASKYLTFSFNTLCYHIFLFNLSFQLFTSTSRTFPNLIFFFVIPFLGFVIRYSTNIAGTVSSQNSTTLCVFTITKFTIYLLQSIFCIFLS